MKKSIRRVETRIDLFDDVSVDVMDEKVAITRYKMAGDETTFSMVIISIEEARKLLEVLQEELDKE